MIGFDPLVVPIGPWAVRAFGLLALVGLGLAIASTVRSASARAAKFGVPT